MTSPASTAAPFRVLSPPARAGRWWSGRRPVRSVLAATLLAAGCSSLPADEVSGGGSTAGVIDVGRSEGGDLRAQDEVSDGEPVDGSAPPALDGAVDPGGWSVPDVPIQTAASLDDLVVPDRPAPVGLRVVSVGIDAAVTEVGIRPDGDLEVPAEAEIGWYRFGPEPGGPGSSVVAAHVDYNGRPGAFFPLRDTVVGDVVEVDRADGSTLQFEVVSVARHGKDELPPDLWRRDGAPQLVLITCGGPFDSRVRSYEDNVVVVAVPIG